ncbi:unnamed protein product [Gemmata massiliana]|uniref:Uncharacterized protein n=1 Tax=Gemmata massiliana TaxID=1210884 RepID=A0A6P2D044_9BACT|nr:hypothetical protein [Gemmata massiliana]VTR92830.1 unnamed protein product [Gemmata massiliana]
MIGCQCHRCDKYNVRSDWPPPLWPCAGCGHPLPVIVATGAEAGCLPSAVVRRERPRGPDVWFVVGVCAGVLSTVGLLELFKLMR